MSNRSVSNHRKEAQRHTNERNRLFQRSKSAHGATEKKQLLNEAQEETRLMHEANKQAAAAIFKENNEDRGRPKTEIDLHGLYVGEAEEIVYEKIDNMLNDPKCSKLKFIVGRGKHSPGHVPVLMPAIEEVISCYYPMVTYRKYLGYLVAVKQVTGENYRDPQLPPPSYPRDNRGGRGRGSAGPRGPGPRTFCATNGGQYAEEIIGQDQGGGAPGSQARGCSTQATGDSVAPGANGPYQDNRNQQQRLGRRGARTQSGNRSQDVPQSMFAQGSYQGLGVAASVDPYIANVDYYGYYGYGTGSPGATWQGPPTQQYPPNGQAPFPPSGAHVLRPDYQAPYWTDSNRRPINYAVQHYAQPPQPGWQRQNFRLIVGAGRGRGQEPSQSDELPGPGKKRRRRRGRGARRRGAAADGEDVMATPASTERQRAAGGEGATPAGAGGGEQQQQQQQQQQLPPEIQQQPGPANNQAVQETPKLKRKGKNAYAKTK